MDKALSVDRMNPRAVWLGVGVMLIAAMLMIGPLLLDVERFFEGYLLGWCLWVGPCLGAGAILMIHQLSGGGWGETLLPGLRAAVGVLPFVALLFLPMLIGAKWLYPWPEYANSAPENVIPFKAYYLTYGFVLLRSVVYLAIWGIGGWWLRVATRPGRGGASASAAIGLILYVLTCTFAFYDWVAALDVQWYSSIYGFYTVIGQLVAALSLSIVVLSWGPTRLRIRLSEDRLHDLGNLLLVAVVLWAYMAFSQFFIVWNGDLPHQVAWYEKRTDGVWGAAAVLLIVVHFALPFTALLFRAAKRRGATLAAIASVVLAAHVLEMTWRIVPAYRQPGLLTALAAAGSTLGIGCGAAMCFLWLFERGDDPPGRGKIHG